MAHQIEFAEHESPLGKLVLAHSGEGLAAVELVEGNTERVLKKLRGRLERRFGEVQLVRGQSRLDEVLAWLKSYFAAPGKSSPFRGKLDFGGTAFQQRVWKHLLKIPAGKTETYGEVARKLGSANASRAVGGACGANPLPIVVPCHRVVATGGGLGGFGLGGLKVKARMLKDEGWPSRS